MSRIALQVVLLGTLGGGLEGQQLQPVFARWHAETLSVGSARLRQEDYRYEGLIFGGVALGALGAWVGSQISGACPLGSGSRCGTDRVGNAVMLGLSGAAIGGGLGYLVGRLSPKRPSPPIIFGEPSQNPAGIPDSVRLRIGYQHWRGAAIGTGVGAVLGGALALVGGSGCADCTITTWDRARAALVVTGAGGVLGFLAGLSSPRYVWVQPGDAGAVDSDSNRE
jgi:hypothetical protein